MCLVTVLCDPDFEPPEEDWEEEFGELILSRFLEEKIVSISISISSEQEYQELLSIIEGFDWQHRGTTPIGRLCYLILEELSAYEKRAYAFTLRVDSPRDYK